MTLWTDDLFEEDDAEAGVRWIDLGNAISTWSVMQDRPTRVSEAVMAFNCTPEAVRKAVEEHPWMFLSGDFIEHEGE